MTNGIERYIQRREAVLDETLSEIDSLRRNVCRKENRRINRARYIQKNIEETNRLSDEQLTLKSCEDRVKCDLDPAYRVANEVLDSLFKIMRSRGYEDYPWISGTERLVSPGLYRRTSFEDESRPTVEEQGLRQIADLIISIPINWSGQIQRREMKQKLYKSLTRNKSPWNIAEELLEKVRKVYFTQLAKIDRKYKEQTTLGMKIDKQACKDCHETKVRTKKHFGIHW